MADIIRADVVAHAAELSTGVSDTAWVDILNYANQVNLNYFGDSDYDTRMARIYLAAHIATMSVTASTGAVGPVISESVGGARRTYAFIQSSSSSASLTTTKYGQQYQDIIASSCAHGPFLV